jgi:murein DD-endopeptidase MepM/ murein hydrolase activator NlpD
MESPIGIIKDLFRSPELSINTYSYPFPPDTKIAGIEKGGKSHSGPYKGAIDFVTSIGTPILSPLDGVIEMVVDTNDKYGPAEEFKDFLNYVTIKHSNGEYSQPAHFAKGSVKVKVGDIVKTGDLLGESGLSGWMDKPHIHFLVFRSASTKEGFIGLEPKFK